jgi:hypothetical protein
MGAAEPTVEETTATMLVDIMYPRPVERQAGALVQKTLWMRSP